MKKSIVAALALLSSAGAVVTPKTASAFCGFFVSSAGGQLFSDATMVVLMRDGTRTVLSMQNNYRGPLEDFALVVPVPVVLKKEQVRTLPNEVFGRIDALASPRLVEYQLPGTCPSMDDSIGALSGAGDAGLLSKRLAPEPPPREVVRVEAKFDVDEYGIVILSAEDSTGLEVWLRENKYKIPEGAEPYLRPYVQGGWKFFVARVIAKKVKMVRGQAVLSPLRFHYDSEAFSLPVRLGLMNSAGSQDLIVHLIGKTRYEIANRKNINVATNLELKRATIPRFGSFYSALIGRTFEKFPQAVVTEFAWQGAMPPPVVMRDEGIYGVTCDPCPPPSPVDDPLTRLLGAEVLPGIKTDRDVAKFAQEATLTRLHLRYSKTDAIDDLVFTAAAPLEGGVPAVKEPREAKKNRFQGRYITWKPFDPNMCWAGGFGGTSIVGQAPSLAPAKPLALPMEEYMFTDVPELQLVAAGLKKKAK